MKEEVIHVPRGEKGAFRLQLAGVSHCDGTYQIERKSSPICVLEYVVKGSGYYEVDGHEYYPSSGDIYIVPPNTAHRYGSSVGDPWNKFWFNVEGELIDSLLRAYHLEGVHHVTNCEALQSVFERGLDILREDPVAGSRESALVVHEILMGVAELNTNKVRRGSPEAHNLQKYLDIHVREDISLEDMGCVVNKSVSQTIRLFKKEWGVTPYQYLLTRKLEFAKELLHNRSNTLSFIADELSFADEFYFSNLFKKKVGMSPGAYRKKNL